jgi:mevalonate kinase
VDSKIPVASGLGSSAAVAVATVAATGKKLGVDLSKEEIINLSLEAEKYVHINPSGIDQTISTYGGILLFKKNEISIINAPHNIPFIIGNSGVPRVTGDLVSKVRRMTTKYPQITNYILQAAGSLTIKALDAIKERNLQSLGELMSLNHGMLISVGVSSITLDNLVYAAKRGGALGAKLTGAGGGGCVIALCTPDRIDTVMEEIRKAGGTPILVKKADKGVVTWLEN